MSGSFKHRMFQVLEAGHPGDRLSLVFDWSLILLILANVAAVITEIVEPLALRHASAFWAFEVFSVGVFTLEYAARLWVATEHQSLARYGPLRICLNAAFARSTICGSSWLVKSLRT